jgi:hypothetical protein
VKGFVTILLSTLLLLPARAVDYSDCFLPGEKIRYKVSWMGIPLAWSETSAEQFIEDGRPLIRVRIISKTYKAYSHIYKVDDLVEAIIDPVTALPLRISFNIREGSRRKSQTTLFYHDQKMAIFRDRLTKDTREIPIERDTRDLISFMYANRKQDMQILTEQQHKLLVDGKLYALDLNILQDGNIKLPGYGTVPCVKIEPIAEFDGLFLRKGKISFWVSKQNRRMVTCMTAKIPVGKVSIKLQNVSGPGDDFWITNK